MAGTLKCDSLQNNAGTGPPDFPYAFTVPYVTKTTTYTATTADRVINCPSGTFTLTLPAASTKGIQFDIINSGTGVITISRAGSDTIGPSSNTSIILSNKGEKVTLLSDGSSSWIIVKIFKANSIQTFLSSSGTYTTPTTPTPISIRVRMVGAGGGGGGSGTIAGTPGTAATAGGNTTFGTSLLVANGGNGASNWVQNSNSGLGGTGGTASLGTGPVGIAVSGGVGQAGGQDVAASGLNGGQGASSAFGGGGGGAAANANQTGVAGATNTGGGGGGAGVGSSSFGGAGGGSGGFVDAIIVAPSTTYAYAVGAVGAAGALGTSGAAGGAGGSGGIWVEEIYG